MDSLEDIINKALPMLQESDHNNLLTHLAGIGVQTESDLLFVTLEDMKGVIPLIAGRRLIHYIKKRGKKYY